MAKLKTFNKFANGIKKKRLEKRAFLPPNTVACGIAKIVQNERGFEIVKDSEAICIPMDGNVVGDILTTNFYVYCIYENLEEIKLAFENGELHPNEKFCHSRYDCNGIFPDLKFKQTKKEVEEYLKEYNRVNNTILYWSFLDEEEKKELDEIAEANVKRYSNLHY